MPRKIVSGLCHIDLSRVRRERYVTILLRVELGNENYCRVHHFLISSVIMASVLADWREALCGYRCHGEQESESGQRMCQGRERFM